MFVRSAFVLLGLAISLPAAAQEMTADQARKFVIGKTFAYSCFDGTRGAGRIRGDGSVAGTIQVQGKGTLLQAVLPSNTIRVKGEKVCASVRGIPFEPCFNVVRTSTSSFRGSISGMSFAYCDFTRGGGRRTFMRASVRERSRPLALRSTITQ